MKSLMLGLAALCCWGCQRNLSVNPWTPKEEHYRDYYQSRSVESPSEAKS